MRLLTACGVLLATFLLALGASTTTVLAHAYPKTTDPETNARLGASPAHVSITYDSPVDQHASTLRLLNSNGSLVTTTPDQLDSTTQTGVTPPADLPPGAYTVAWTSLSTDDGHTAQGFYTFVVNGGVVGIVNGMVQSSTPAADLTAALTVTAAPDGGSLLRVDLSNTTDVERVRIRLSGPDLGEDLLDTQPGDDGGWVLNGNEVAVPGAWKAVVIARRTNVVDDATGTFNFTINPATGEPTFT
jgi:methionine-rich copper-binding protein CopC